MKETAGRPILQTMAEISESFKQLNITYEGILEVIDYNQYVHLFENVPDFRQKCKIVYELPDLLMMIFMVVILRGKESYLGIADQIEGRQKLFRDYGLIKGDAIPSHDTIRRILSLLNSDSLYEETLAGFYRYLKSLEKQFQKSGQYSHLAVDGKEMRGSGRADDTASPARNRAHLNIYDSGTMTCICCEPIDEKENEIPVSQRLLAGMNLKKVIVTADALHCQRKTCDIIHQNKGLYVFTVKENQELLDQEINTRFDKYANQISTYEREGRTIQIYHLPKGYCVDGFTGMKCFARMKSRKCRNGCERRFISNSTDDELICSAIESRWQIEDGFHREKDALFCEDGVTATDKNALHNIALLNNLAFQLFHLYQAISGKEFRKARVAFEIDPLECISQILGVMNSEEITDKLKKELKKH